MRLKATDFFLKLFYKTDPDSHQPLKQYVWHNSGFNLTLALDAELLSN